MITTSSFGSRISRQVVLPPKPRFSGCGVGIEPRTPQNFSWRRKLSSIRYPSRPLVDNPRKARPPYTLAGNAGSRKAQVWPVQYRIGWPVEMASGCLGGQIFLESKNTEDPMNAHRLLNTLPVLAICAAGTLAQAGTISGNQACVPDSLQNYQAFNDGPGTGCTSPANPNLEYYNFFF